MQNCMVVGVDVCHAGRRSLVGLAATYTPYFTQHFSKVYPQQLHKELIGKMQDGRPITKDYQETVVCKERTQILEAFMKLALENYMKKNKVLPSTIAVYRDGVGGPSMMQKVLD